VQQRPDKGLLGGMLGVPTSEWGVKPSDHSAAPMRRNWQRAGEIKHVFTHFELRLEVLPTVFKKVVAAAMKSTRP